MESQTINNKKRYLVLLGPLLLIILLVGITYAFFNYTRTGLLNNIGTGRISFSSEQNGSIQLTNVFPISSSEVGNGNADTLTVRIWGDTTYDDGEEFLVSIADVNNSVMVSSTEKSLPISYIASYEATPVATGEDPNTIGSSNDNYFTARNSKNANIYKLYSEGVMYEDKQVLVGYIKNGNTGIDGTLTIKAFVDADKIAISDTYPESNVGYKVNSNMNQTTLNACINYFVSIEWNQYLQPGETLESFCRGNGTLNGWPFQNYIDYGTFYDSNLEDMLEQNIVIFQNYSNDTTEEWADGRTVFTTNEWNSLGEVQLSFKIKVESNEGIWVEELGKVDACQGCKFIYLQNSYAYMVDNIYNEPPTELVKGLYDDYNELMAITGKKYFLGVNLNDSNQATNAYVCGVKNDTAFCTTSPQSESDYNSIVSYLNSESLYNNTCSEQIMYESEPDEFRYTLCGVLYDSQSIFVGIEGSTIAAGLGGGTCNVNGEYGAFYCHSGR